MAAWSARLLHWLCLSLLVSTAWAAPDSRQEELEDLRARIQALQKEVEAATETRSEAADALKKSERRISDVNRGLRQLELRQRDLSRSLKQLAQDSKTTQSEIVDQQSRLAELLRQRYIHGDNDAIKLMLNGQNPGEAARNLEYYGYVGRSRSQLIREHQATLARMRDLEASVRDKQAGLEQVKKDRVDQKKALESEKAARQDVLYKLSSQIRRQRNEINTLVQNEKRLTQLIERLARLAAKRKAAKPAVPARPGEKVDRVADASLAGLNFARLKGKLALPVAGEILHRFGQGRPGGGPAWKGLFIRARQGQEVRAVGTGKVAFADWLRGFGNLLIVDHGDGFLSLYSNNESLYKQPGDPVQAGDVVATVGATGGQDEPGLYFELRRQGKPFDPMTWVR
ncbi:MAG: peptidoglycan DD-metalloendopeptidase family protein [Thiobacillus sp.]|nr:peptidoglycan DD-metalloendopeptidase family protein [Thiobacillus sp.]